jgi:molybdate transport system ATP-binding protein
MLDLRIEVRRNGFTLEAAFSAGPGPTLLVGPNGAGKTTLLRAVLGALPVDRGRLTLAGRVLLDSEARVDVPLERRRVGWVPQEYALFPHLTVLGNIGFGARGHRRDRAARAEELLLTLGLERLGSRYPGSLSGGERQKVALARALAASPEALLLDEPLAALDAEARVGTRSFLATTLAELGIPSLVVSHDLRDVAALQGPVIVLEGGRITGTGSLAALMRSPPSGFGQTFFREPGAVEAMST